MNQNNISLLTFLPNVKIGEKTSETAKNSEFITKPLFKAAILD